MKKILMLLAFAGVAAASSAQQVTVTETEVIEVQDKYQVLTNPSGATGSSQSVGVRRCFTEMAIMQENLKIVSVLS